MSAKLVGPSESFLVTPARKPPAIQCRGLTKEFGTGAARVRALRGVDLDVMGGELTLLVGPSGCGKTTLLSVMAGILNASGGTLHVFGEDMTAMSDSAKVRFRAENIGFIFQQFNLLPTLTAAENAMVPLLIAGMPRRAALAKAKSMLDAVGLGDRVSHMPWQLSGGQQQRVAIARALVHEPRLLVCDEPTSALDAHTGHAVMELLRNTALEQDRVVLVVTHDARVMEFGDRIAHMEDGYITKIETRDGVVAAQPPAGGHGSLAPKQPPAPTASPPRG